MATRFRIATRQTGRRREVQVVVYDELKDLQKAAMRYPFESEGSFEKALAVSQPRQTVIVDGEGGERRCDGAGIVRFWREQMGAAILAHEMTHMALAIYREDFGSRRSLSNMKNEETLCHIVSDLVRSANRKLWELGIYTAEAA
jgi:hypothetical protein